jgi:hypothetical protein
LKVATLGLAAQAGMTIELRCEAPNQVSETDKEAHCNARWIHENRAAKSHQIWI